MTLNIEHKDRNCTGTIQVTGSKSESNRLLILQALFGNLTIQNLSNSDDTLAMQKALQSTDNIIDIGHAGTTMRFLTSYFATQKGRQVILTGSARMQQRPIETLVSALNEVGTNITYENQVGYPPLRIVGTDLTKNTITLSASTSSQYISSLLLVAPKLKEGLNIVLEGKITSLPYIQMTIDLLKKIGVDVSFKGNTISVLPKKEIEDKEIHVESDWSAASYYYSCCALSNDSKLVIRNYNKDSLQGDSYVAELYKKLGVKTTYSDTNTIVLEKEPNFVNPTKISVNLNDTPDIAQTLAVTCVGLGINCNITGLHTLKIKETDRLVALKNELSKFGAHVEITDDSLTLDNKNTQLNKDNTIEIATYDDHRMAMAFAPMALKRPITILEAEVVSKSYPTFWEDMKKVGFIINTV